MSDPDPSTKNQNDDPRYPAEVIEHVCLKDGTPVTIRPIRPEDASELQEGFARLSPNSIYLRFLETFKILSDAQAHFFANVDYQERMALVAEIDEHGDKNLIGVARYSLIGPQRPGLAESAVVVVDEYQGRGLGTMLLERLIRYAHAHGATTFLATIHMTNAQMMHFIRRSGFPYDRRMLEPGVWEVLIHLPEPGETHGPT